jgi:response regulator of citrate/malate metabolism
MSGSDEMERVGACIAQGAAMYLIKPLEMRVLKHIWQVW